MEKGKVEVEGGGGGVDKDNKPRRRLEERSRKSYSFSSSFLLPPSSIFLPFVSLFFTLINSFHVDCRRACALVEYRRSGRPRASKQASLHPFFKRALRDLGTYLLHQCRKQKMRKNYACTLRHSAFLIFIPKRNQASYFPKSWKKKKEKGSKKKKKIICSSVLSSQHCQIKTKVEDEVCVCTYVLVCICECLCVCMRGRACVCLCMRVCIYVCV